MFVPSRSDLVLRYKDNPIITPADIKPSIDGFEVIGAFNAAAFEYEGKIGLLLRVAERPVPERGWISTAFFDPESNCYKIKRFREDNPSLDLSDPRIILYKKELYLSSISHLRLAWSDDGINFRVEDSPTIQPSTHYEIYGIEDGRVTKIEDTYYITYSAVSDCEVGVGLIETKDWKRFSRRRLLFHPFNKDVAIFPAKINGKYWILHRPSGVLWKRNWIWLSTSPDLEYVGQPICLLKNRPRRFDSARLGAGAPPILTDYGFLEIYHGATEKHKYSLGAVLLDRDNPRKVLARSEDAFMKPIAKYEKKGFFGGVVFTDGIVLRDGVIWIYYGAADSITCLASIELDVIWRHLRIK